ncbi:helix-turn-helix domain-containing protein [Nibrella saemangeumensis]|uniref:Helix-turn-helix domain-containing protein n=1 Tax=Nibrella saemangeumensis TaxID=1084526 RepID=A0ABP8MNA0_9BACT
MSLSFLQLVLVSGALQGFCLAVLLFTRPVNRLANRLLGAVMVLMSLQTILVSFDNREFFMRFPHLSHVGWLLPSLFGPLLFLFTQKLISERPRWQRTDWLHFAPFVLLLLYLMPYYLQSAEAKRAYLSDFAQSVQDDFGPVNSLLNVLHIVYISAAVYGLRRHERRVLNEYSEVQQLRLRWLQQFLSLVLVLLVSSVLIFYARKWNIPGLGGLYRYHYLGVIVLIYWIGYKALSQPVLFNQKPVGPATKQDKLLPVVPEPIADDLSTETAEKYKKSALPDELSDRYQARLLAYMDEEKPYRNQTLTIHELAEALNISRHHLSQVLNDRLGRNFYDFVNEYRVAEVKRLLTDPQYSHYTTLGIAEEAGFNSKATFNAVFKKMTGQTPSEYVGKAAKPV